MKELDQLDQKYIAELYSTLQQYLDAKHETVIINSGNLLESQLGIRSAREHAATEKLREAYGKRYESEIMVKAKHDVAELIHEESGNRSVLEFIQKTKKQSVPQKIVPQYAR